MLSSHVLAAGAMILDKCNYEHSSVFSKHPRDLGVSTMILGNC